MAKFIAQKSPESSARTDHRSAQVHRAELRRHLGHVRSQNRADSARDPLPQNKDKLGRELAYARAGRRVAQPGALPQPHLLRAARAREHPTVPGRHFRADSALLERLQRGAVFDAGGAHGGDRQVAERQLFCAPGRAGADDDEHDVQGHE